ncbi:MAG: hypothetical protein QX198_16755, partial [Methylococcaceae bacterium]
MTTWESNNSRSDVIIEDVRTNSNVTTVSFVESDPGNVDLGVYFNERNLVNTTSSASSITLQIMDTVAAAAGAAPLRDSTYGSFTFTATIGATSSATTIASQGIQDAQTYDQMVTAFQTALDLQFGAGVIKATLGSDFTVTDPASGKAVTGQSIVLTAAASVVFSTPVGSGWASTGTAPAASNFYTNWSQGSTAAAALVSTSIILDDVGLGDTGGDLVVGGMSTGVTSNDNGVQLFNIEVRDNSKLQTINSTNNTLREVNIVNGATTSSSSAYVTTVTDKGNLTVNGFTTANTVIDTPLAGTNAIAGTNQTIDHSSLGSAGFMDVRLINAAAMTGKFAFTAAITSDSISKYMNLVDIAASHTADVATAGQAGLGANFIYTGGANNDTMVVNIDSTVASSRSTMVSGFSDFTFALNGGAGDDAITLTLQGAGNATQLAGGAQAWYTNQKLNANITIDGGEGNDTIRTPGAGDVIINGGAGNDTIYTDNTGALGAAPNATGTAGPAAVAYSNAAAAELAANLAAAVTSNATGFFNAPDGTVPGTSITTAAVVVGLEAIDLITPSNTAVLPVITHATLAAATATAVTSGFITLAQKAALDTAYNSSTPGAITAPTVLGAASTQATVAVAGNVTAGEMAAGDVLLATYMSAARAANAAATAADANVLVHNLTNNTTQTAVINATMAMNQVADLPNAVAAGTAVKVAGLTALQSALVAGATDATVVAAINTAIANGSFAPAGAAGLFTAATGVAIGTIDAAEALAVTAILSPLQNAAANANTAAQTTLTAALAADVLIVNQQAAAAAADPVFAITQNVTNPGAGNDAVGSTEVAAAAAAAAALATGAAGAAAKLAAAQSISTILAGLKGVVVLGALDATVNNAIDNAAIATAAAAVTAGIADPIAVATVAALKGLAGSAVLGSAVTAPEALTFATGPLGIAGATSIDTLIIANNVNVDRLAIISADAAATAAATATASTITTAAANSGTTSLTLAAPKAVFVFDTSNQAATYNRLTQDDRNLADLKSDASNSYNFFNSTVKVTYKGIDASVVVAGGTDFKTTDLQINQALKLAINSDAVLSKLLLATDGPANTLVVTSLIDGTHTTANLAVTVTLPTTAGSNVAAAATSYGLAAGATDAQVLTAMSTAKALFDTKGDYTTQFAESGAANANVTLVGANSVSSSDNTITGGTGNDVIVLGTTVGTDGLTSSNELVKFAANFGNDTVVNFAASGLGIDTLDFSALNGRGNVALGSLSLDKSIVIGAPTATPLSATAIAALFTDSATAINHVYVEVNSTNIGSVYTVADAAGTTAGNVVATLTGTLDLA